ncbi:DUF6049 family protein [Angustibacter sp. McL0619]|uniref:DUF6049 family protein n=1 Tax=Angustibacter sp. McL0619 TaxID=3415676 RepID=UPI003CF12836
MTPRKVLAATAAGLLVALTGTLAQPTTAAAQATAARIVITSVTPTLVTQADTVHVTGRVTNLTKGALEQVTVRLRAVGGRLGTRDDVDNWLDGRDVREGVPVDPPTDLAKPLAAGASATFALDVPATSLALEGGEFGAYPIAVDARATDAEGTRDQVAFLRTTVQWQPATREYARQQISWMVPFAGLPGPVANSVPTAEQLTKALTPGQRLPNLLAAASVPGVAWAVDPQLLQTLQLAVDGSLPSSAGKTASATSTAGASTTPTPTGTATSSPSDQAKATASTVALAFLDQMRTAAVGRDVIELPYADPDLQVVSDADAMQLVTAARAAGAGTIAEVLGVIPRNDIAWPPDGYASDSLVGDLAGQGVPNLVLDERSRPLVDALDYTPDDVTKSLPAGATAVLFDSQLSRLMVQVRSTDASASSRFLAETAAATTERPGLTRRMLVALPRAVALDPTAFRATVQAATGAPWLTLTPSASMFEPLPDRGDASQLARRSVAAPRTRTTTGIDTADVETALSLRSQLSALGEVVAEPAKTTAALQRSTLDLVSAVWRNHRPVLAQRQQISRVAVSALSAHVRVLKTTITFLRRSGEFQLTISNTLPQRVTGIRLRVLAPSPRLVVSKEVSDPIDLAPGTRTSVRVPVRALASGQVALQAQLVAPSDLPIGAPVQVEVRVRPTDSWVLSVGGVIVGLVVLVGLVRALRRPRRRARLVDIETNDIETNDIETNDIDSSDVTEQEDAP